MLALLRSEEFFKNNIKHWLKSKKVSIVCFKKKIIFETQWTKIQCAKGDNWSSRRKRREIVFLCFILQIIWCKIIFGVVWTIGNYSNYRMQFHIIIRHERQLFLQSVFLIKQMSPYVRVLSDWGSIDPVRLKRWINDRSNFV